MQRSLTEILLDQSGQWRQQQTHLPPPFSPEFKVNVQKVKQAYNVFDISSKTNENCLMFSVDRINQTMDIHSIFFQVDWRECFPTKIHFPDIILGFKEIATMLSLNKINLSDASYIPVKGTPSYKILNLLKNGKTIYMEQGFFFLPSFFVDFMDIVLKHFTGREDYERKKKILFYNALVVNQVFSRLFIRCSSSISLRQLRAYKDIQIPDGLTENSSLQELARWMISVFRKEPDDSPKFIVATNNYKNLMSFFKKKRENLINVFLQYMNISSPESLVQTLLEKPRRIYIENPILLLTQLISGLNDFKTVMYRIEEAKWTQYLSPAQQQQQQRIQTLV